MACGLGRAGPVKDKTVYGLMCISITMGRGVNGGLIPTYPGLNPKIRGNHMNSECNRAGGGRLHCQTTGVVIYCHTVINSSYGICRHLGKGDTCQ